MIDGAFDAELETRLRATLDEMIPKLVAPTTDRGTTTAEGQIGDFSGDQSEAARLSEARPEVQLARAVESPSPRRRARLLMAAAAAALVVVSGVAIAERQADPPAAGTTQPFHFETPTVVMDATSVEVVAAGQTFVPSADLRVEGDPGTPNEYTTLELTWHERGIEQRINIYFASDGSNWWASEIRTYNGQPNGDWVEPTAQGHYFKSALGAAYIGDLDLPNLRIHGMKLEAFRRPSACSDTSKPIALVTDYPVIDATPGGFGASLEVVDTATCSAIPVAPYSFEYTSDDRGVAVIEPPEDIPDYPPTKTRIGVQLVAPGATTVHAVAKDGAGIIVGTADMHVIVRLADGAVTQISASSTPTTANVNP